MNLRPQSVCLVTSQKLILEIIKVIIYVNQMSYDKITNKYDLHTKYEGNLNFSRPNYVSDGSVQTSFLLDALSEFDKMIDILLENEIPISHILGLRNLSAFVGEVYNRCVTKVAKELIKNNPHQDGYPDLLIMDKLGQDEWNKIGKRIYEKEPFSFFATGGIEVKATCGDLRSAKWFTENSLLKPQIGEQRLEWITGYNWKSHHQLTNNLIGIIWDFVDTKPTIIAIMYSNLLNENDWGNTVTPKKGGGRTTSVSIMNAKGIKKMRSGLLAIIKDQYDSHKVLKRLDKY